MTDDSWKNDSVRPSNDELTNERVVEHAPQPQDGDGRETEITRGTPATVKEPVAFLLAEGMKVSAGPRPGTYRGLHDLWNLVWRGLGLVVRPEACRTTLSARAGLTGSNESRMTISRFHTQKKSKSDGLGNPR